MVQFASRNCKAISLPTFHAPVAAWQLGVSREAHDICDAPCSAIGTLCSIALIVHAKEISRQAAIALFPLCT
jgi:hypothetical protein